MRITSLWHSCAVIYHTKLPAILDWNAGTIDQNEQRVVKTHFLDQKSHQWNSRALQTFPTMGFFLHTGITKLLQSAANQSRSYESWKYSSVTSRNFWQLSHLNIFLYIDLSCTEIHSSLSPGLTHFPNPHDRQIFETKTCPWCLSLQRI